jgi:hypothetical protein
MAWDPRQLEALYANVYGRCLECPACGGRLGLVPSGDLYAVGVVACRACATHHFIAVRNDPLRATFRAYTEQENRDLFAAERSRRIPVCPVDGTEMDVHLQRSLGRTSNAVIRCRRCAHQAEYVRAHG